MAPQVSQRVTQITVNFRIIGCQFERNTVGVRRLVIARQPAQRITEVAMMVSNPRVGTNSRGYQLNRQIIAAHLVRDDTQ